MCLLLLQEIKVHKAAMAACSDYFRVMLTGNMRESREQYVELKGVTAGGLKVKWKCIFMSVSNESAPLPAPNHTISIPVLLFFSVWITE